MAVPFSNTKLRVPHGFQNLLEGLAREVLRAQPKNILEFGSDYFGKMMTLRDETGEVDMAKLGAQLTDRFYNNTSFQKPEIDPGDPQQQNAALAIQTEVRRHQAKKEVDALREEGAAATIQAGFRGFQDRKVVSEMRKSAELREQTSDETPAEPSSSDLHLNNPEYEAAATKIQAGFKGYKVRKDLASRKSQLADEAKTEPAPQPEVVAQVGQAEEEEEVDIDLEDPEVEKAAIKIQAGFKGFKARKELTSGKAEEQTEESKEVIDIDLNDPQVQGAAVKIQAGYRGMQTRHELKKSKDAKLGGETAGISEEFEVVEVEVHVDVEEEVKTESEARQDEGQTTTEGEEMPDINDPAVADAAVKIQAGFRGHKAREEVAAMKAEREGSAKTEEAKAEGEEVVDIDLNDPDVANAAVKIQAGFKGYKTRKSIAEMKVTDGESAAAPDASDIPEATTEAPVEAPVAEEAPAEAPVEAPATEEAPAEEPAAEEAPAEAPAAEEAPAEASANEEAPAEAPVAEEAPAEAPAAEETSAEAPAAEEAPAEAPEAEEAPAEAPAAEEAPAEAPANEEAPAEAPAAEEAPAEAPAAEEAPAETAAAAEEAPAEATAAAEEAPAEAPAEEAPEAPAEAPEAPSEDAPKAEEQ